MKADVVGKECRCGGIRIGDGTIHDPLCPFYADVTNTSDFEISGAMIELGGSFVKRLGELFRYADGPNQLRLKEAFPDYWEKYRQLASIKNHSD